MGVIYRSQKSNKCSGEVGDETVRSILVLLLVDHVGGDVLLAEPADVIVATKYLIVVYQDEHYRVLVITLFVEFLEMLCRIAIVALDMEDTLDYKTYTLLGLIYEKYYKIAKLSKDDYPLCPVDEVLR